MRASAALVALGPAFVMHGAAITIAGSKGECFVPSGVKIINASDPRGGTFPMAVHVGGDIVSEELARRGYWEIQQPKELAALAGSTLPERGTLMDIGAHVGWYTLAFAKLGFDAIAVEPMRENLQALRLSLCLNPDVGSKVQVVRAALVAPGMRVGKCFVRPPRDMRNHGNGNIWCGASGLQPPCSGLRAEQCEEVPMKTADQVLAELRTRRVDVVKMDVEGSECNVLRGSNDLLGRFRPKLVQVETKVPLVAGCFQEAAAGYAYLLGPDHGHDENRVAVKSEAVPKTQLAAGRRRW